VPLQRDGSNRDNMTIESARHTLRAFIARSPATIRLSAPLADQDQGTNSVVFRGTWNDQSAIFKVRLRGPGDEEARALRCLSGTGLAPELFAAEGPVVVMEAVSGRTWHAQIRAGSGLEPALIQSCTDAIAAISAIGVGPLSSEVDLAGLRCNVDRLLASARALLAANPDIYGDPVFAETFGIVEAAAPAILAAPPALFFADPDPRNLMVRDGRFTRFIDLEALWAGTAPLAVGAALHVLARADLTLGLPFAAVGPALRASFDRVLALRLPADLVRSSALFSLWIQIARYHGWNGWQTWSPGRLTGDLDHERASADVYALTLRRIVDVAAEYSRV
jgi:hypothetical protein